MALTDSEKDDIEIFQKDMLKVLEENSYKGGWDRKRSEWLLMRLKQEILELELAMVTRNGQQKECIDIANFAMMLYSKWR